MRNWWRRQRALILWIGLALLVRAFVIEAFRIPSPSMVPTLLVGDFIFVNKFRYGLRIPFTTWWPAHFQPLRHGEVVVFIYPIEPDKNYIKRVIGLPGDTVRVVGHDVSVNGEPLAHEEIDPPAGAEEPEYFYYYRERHGAQTYTVQYERHVSDADETFVVPAGQFFVMGDNRNHSADSRYWGTVPMENLKGRALFIWLSWDGARTWIRPERFGRGVR